MTTDEPAPIRILLANLSDVLANMIVEMVERHPQMRMVGQVEGQFEVLVAVQAGVDVLVLGASNVKPAPGIVSHLLNEFPFLKIVVLSTNEDRAMGYWLGVHRCPIDRSTTDTLMTGIEALYKLTPST